MTPTYLVNKRLGSYAVEVYRQYLIALSELHGYPVHTITAKVMMYGGVGGGIPASTVPYEVEFDDIEYILQVEQAIRDIEEKNNKQFWALVSAALIPDMSSKKIARYAELINLSLKEYWRLVYNGLAYIGGRIREWASCRIDLC